MAIAGAVNFVVFEGIITFLGDLTVFGLVFLAGILIAFSTTVADAFTSCTGTMGGASSTFLDAQPLTRIPSNTKETR
jgi:hypothetical protein